MWTLDKALDIIQAIQADVRKFNYHVTLGGGVLNTGSSDHDLDLFILPLNNTDQDKRGLMGYLISVLGNYKALRDSPDYGPDMDNMYSEMVMFDVDGRIDVFVL